MPPVQTEPSVGLGVEDLCAMASYTGTGRDTARIQHLEEDRKRKKADLERQKNAISEASTTYKLGENFVSHKESVEELLKRDTVGLVSFDDFKARREYLEQCAAEEREKREAEKRELESLARKRRLKKANKAQLSFAGDDDEEDEQDDDLDAEREKALLKKKV